MPAKSNPVHMDAFPALYRLSTHANQMSTHATRQPLTSEQTQKLTQLAIAALKASGVSRGDIQSQLDDAFSPLATGLKPSPASQEARYDPIPTKAIDPIPASAQTEKKGGLFR